MAMSLSTFQLDLRSPLGIAAQIRARIALLIADGELNAGDRLPSVRELARQLGVNVNTARSAYAELEADGLVSTRHGVGTTVLPVAADWLLAGHHSLGTNTVGVLIGGLDPFYLDLLRGIEDVAAEQSTLVLIADTRDSPELAGAMIKRLLARGIDGVIAVSVGGIDESDWSNRRGEVDRMPPIVYVDQPDRTGHVFLFDAERAGYLATSHLREHGHERIGILTAPVHWPNVRELYDGYLRGLGGGSESLSHALVSEVEEFTIEAGRSGLAQLLGRPDPPSAVVAASEVLALGAYREARSRGLAIPRDLAIVGYTDSPVTALLEPQLTMVSVPAREIGLLAMRALHGLIQGSRARPGRTVLDVELVLRGSCGSH